MSIKVFYNNNIKISMNVTSGTTDYSGKKYISITFSNDAGLNSAIIKLNSENYSPVKMHIFKTDDARLLFILENRFERNIYEKNKFYLGFYVQDNTTTDPTSKSFNNIIEKIINNNSSTTETLNVYELLSDVETGKISHDDNALNIHTCIVDKPIITKGISDIFNKIDKLNIADIKDILTGFNEPTSIKAELLKGTIEHIQYCEPIDALTSEDYKNTNISKFVDKNELINETFIIVITFGLIFIFVVSFFKTALDGYIFYINKWKLTHLMNNNKPLMLLSTQYWGVLFVILSILYLVYSIVKENAQFMAAGIFFLVFFLVCHFSFLSNKDDNKHDYETSDFFNMLGKFHNPFIFVYNKLRGSLIACSYTFFGLSIASIAVDNTSDLSKEGWFIFFTVGYIITYSISFVIND